MSEPSAALLPAITAALLADVTLVGLMPAGVKVYGPNAIPTNAKKPYLVLHAPQILPVLAECFDLSDGDVSLDVWSLPDPPGMGEAMAIADAARTVMLGSIAADDFVISAQPVRSAHMIDPGDSKTAHSVVVVRYAADPA